jgi:integrase
MASIIPVRLADGTTSWETFVAVSGFPRVTKTFKTEQDAKSFAAITEAALRERRTAAKKKAMPNPKPASGSRDLQNELVADLIRAFRDSPDCSDRYKAGIGTVIAKVGDARVREVGEHWVRDYIEEMRETKTRKGKPYSFSTIHDHIIVIRLAIRQRARVLRVRTPEFEFSKRWFGPKWRVKRRRRLLPAEEKALFGRLRQIARKKRKTRMHWRLLVRLALVTGARLQELVLAEWSEFQSDIVWVIPAAHCKSGEWRPVPLGRAARRIITLLKKLRNPDDLRLFHALGSPLAVSVSFHNYVKQAGIVDFRFHDLRHEAISRWYMFERQLDERHLSCMVGHTSLSQTRDYVLLRADELAAALN